MTPRQKKTNVKSFDQVVGELSRWMIQRAHKQSLSYEANSRPTAQRRQIPRDIFSKSLQEAVLGVLGILAFILLYILAGSLAPVAWTPDGTIPL